MVLAGMTEAGRCWGMGVGRAGAGLGGEGVTGLGAGEAGLGVPGLKKKLLAGWVGVGVTGLGVTGLGVPAVGGLAGWVGVGGLAGWVGVGAGEAGTRTEEGSGKLRGSKLREPLAEEVGLAAVGLDCWAKAVKGWGLAWVGAGLAWGTGVAEKVLPGVGAGRRGAAAVGVGRRAAGAAGLARRISSPPRMFCLSSVWKVPVSGLKTSSLEKLGPTGAAGAAA